MLELVIRLVSGARAWGPLAALPCRNRKAGLLGNLSPHLAFPVQPKQTPTNTTPYYCTHGHRLPCRVCWWSQPQASGICQTQSAVCIAYYLSASSRLHETPPGSLLAATNKTRRPVRNCSPRFSKILDPKLRAAPRSDLMKRRPFEISTKTPGQNVLFS